MSQLMGILMKDGTVKEIARPANPLDGELRMLDVYAGGVADEEPRIDALATISAGTKVPNPKDPSKRIPAKSKDGEIYLHDARGRAPGLKAALEARQFKGLTIAFPFDQPSAFIQQHFAEYSASALKAYGDEHELTIIEGGKHRTIDAYQHREEFRAALAKCKVQVSVYFALAEWGEDGPRVLFPDGIGALYRLRFTSRHSLRNLHASLKQVAAFTRGRIAGVPFDIAIDYRDAAKPDGERVNIPVWTFVMKPPVTLTSRTFAPMVSSALAEGAALMLPPPRPEPIEYAAYEGPVGDDEESISTPTEADVALVEQGGRCDAAHWNRRWHAAVKGSWYATDQGREALLRDWTRGDFGSLAQFLDAATESEAHALLEYVTEQAERDRARQEQQTTERLSQAVQAVATVPSHLPPTESGTPRSYEQLFPDSDTTDAPKVASQQAPAATSGTCTRHGCDEVIREADEYAYEGRKVTGRAWLASCHSKYGYVVCFAHKAALDAGQLAWVDDPEHVGEKILTQIES